MEADLGDASIVMAVMRVDGWKGREIGREMDSGWNQRLQRSIIIYCQTEGRWMQKKGDRRREEERRGGVKEVVVFVEVDSEVREILKVPHFFI
jgi:hypothetical protein